MLPNPIHLNLTSPSNMSYTVSLSLRILNTTLTDDVLHVHAQLDFAPYHAMLS